MTQQVTVMIVMFAETRITGEGSGRPVLTYKSDSEPPTGSDFLTRRET